MKRWTILAAALLLTLLVAGPAAAQRPVSDDEVNAVAKKLYCPVCENTPLDVCPIQVCKDWRALIRQQLSDGWTEQQILDYFVANNGAQVLAQPPAKGFTLLVWILPVVGLAGGGLFLWRWLRREQVEPAEAGGSAGPLGPDDPAPHGVSDEVLARIEQEVEARF
jgi:cytochrome c-type biogenesis protein CcmH